MSARRAVHEALEGRHPKVGRLVVSAVVALILLSAVLVAVETMPRFRGRPVLLRAEIALASLFAVEYLLRLWAAPQRLRYATSFWGIVDFLAAFPALLLLVPDLQTLRALRLLRLLRLLKLARYSQALDRIGRAFATTRDELAIVLFVAVLMIYLAAVGIHHFEREAQPEIFGSIPQSLWWAVATLTTVGYGDAYPITVGGRVFTGLVLMVGLCVVAVPAGLVASALLRHPASPDEEDR